MTILTFTCAFVLDYRRPKSDGQCPVYLRIIKNRVISMLKIGEYVKPAHWNKNAGRVTPQAKDYVRINHRLLSIEKQIQDIRFSLETQNKTAEAKEIIRMLKGEHIQRTRLMDFFDLHIAEMKARPKEFTIGVVRHYKQAQDKLRSFLAITREENIFLSDFTRGHIDRWKHYLLSTNFENTGHPLNENTAGRYQTKLSAIFNKAVMRELLPRSPFENYKIKQVEGKRLHLNMDELNRVATHSLGNNMSLIRVRDAFVFSCYCPCRFGDLVKLRVNSFYTDEEGIMWVAYTAQKTKTPVEIPLFKEAAEIVRRYSSGRRDSSEPLFRGISNQKFNAHLTMIMGICGISKKISAHSARHTCATTTLLNRGCDIRTVQQFLAHASISSTLIYTKVNRLALSGIIKKIDRTG